MNLAHVTNVQNDLSSNSIAAYLNFDKYDQYFSVRMILNTH